MENKILLPHFFREKRNNLFPKSPTYLSIQQAPSVELELRKLKHPLFIK